MAHTNWEIKLTSAQLAEVLSLQQACQSADGAAPLIYEESLLKARFPACNGLVYDGLQLIAFVSVYFFYQHGCECSLMVAPDYRGRGLARSLLRELKKILAMCQQRYVLFTAAPGLQLKHWPRLRFHGTEYQLQRLSNQPLNLDKQQLTIRKATESDAEVLCQLDKACFDSNQHMPSHYRYLNLLSDPTHMLLIGDVQQQSVAKSHIRFRDDAAVLSDICVLPTHQRQGFGSEIINACLQLIAEHNIGKTVLEVEGRNQQAISLYQRLGFTICREINLWQLLLAHFPK